MTIEHLIIVLAAAMALGPSSVAALASWRAARNTRTVGNGFTEHVRDELAHTREELGAIRGLLTAHVNDDRAHRR